MREGLRWVWGLTLLALGGCRPSEPDPPLRGLAALDCERLLPAVLREGVLPGSTLFEEPPCPGCGPVCTIRGPAPASVHASVSYDCPARPRQKGARLIAPLLRAGGVELPGLGRQAALGAPAPGVKQIVALDDDTPCAIVITWRGPLPDSTLELARIALAAASPEVVFAPPGGAKAPAPE